MCRSLPHHSYSRQPLRWTLVSPLAFCARVSLILCCKLVSKSSSSKSRPLSLSLSSPTSASAYVHSAPPHYPPSTSTFLTARTSWPLPPVAKCLESSLLLSGTSTTVSPHSTSLHGTASTKTSHSYYSLIHSSSSMVQPTPPALPQSSVWTTTATSMLPPHTPSLVTDSKHHDTPSTTTYETTPTTLPRRLAQHRLLNRTPPLSFYGSSPLSR